MALRRRLRVAAPGAVVAALALFAPPFAPGVEAQTPAVFTVSATPSTLEEGEFATVTVAISNGVTFAEDQTITLVLSGTASSDDYEVKPKSLTLTLAAGESSVAGELEALEDDEEEETETVTLAASHGTRSIGSDTVMIVSVSHDATLSALSLSGIDIGTFSGAVTRYWTGVDEAVATTTVTATASHPEAEVSIDPGVDVSLAEGVNEIAVTVTAEDGFTTITYTVMLDRVVRPLTARVAEVPPSHDGSTPFWVTLLFSEPILTTYRGLARRSFQVVNGELLRGAPGRFAPAIIVEISPTSTADIVLTLPPTQDCAAAFAVCTASGKPLSQRVTAIIPGPNSAPEGLPIVSGTTVVGNTLTASASGITDADGLVASVFAWQWIANDGTTDTAIAGATAASYTLTSAEAGKTIKARVTFTDNRWTEETLVSEATAPVEPPLTASLVDVPAYHRSGPFRFELRFSEEITVSYVTLRDSAFELVGGRVVKARRLERPSNLRWEIIVVPETNEDVTITLPASPPCDTSGAICTADGKRLFERIATVVPDRVFAAQAPTVTGVSVTSAPGAARRWKAGARVEVEVRFSEAVTVDLSGGTPTLKLWIASVERRAAYASGSGTSTLTFVWEAGTKGASPHPAVVRANSLEGNGGTIRNEAGIDADLGFAVRPAITKLRIAAPPSRNRWTAGEKVSVSVTFNAAVAVETGSEPPELELRLLAGTRNAAYTAGSGTRSLTFAYPVTESDGDVRLVQVPKNALDLNGGTIRNAAHQDADLSHARMTRMAARDAIGIAVDGARAREGVDETITFRVRLAPARTETVSVSWATGDGTARAGEDYTASRGTVSFAPGETAKTITVAILDDAHDEGEETFTVRLSNPSRRYVAAGGRITKPSATGTIVNADAIPAAWLGRFGRTAAEQVLEAVDGRLRVSRRPGFEGRLAGQPLGAHGPELHGGQPRVNTAAGEHSGGLVWRELTGRELVTGTSFTVTGGGGESGSGAVWGRGTVSRFDGREEDLSLDGEVLGAMLGADWTRGRGTLGLVLSHTRGDGSYRGADESGVSSTLTGLFPWGRYALSARLDVWGVAGYGTGRLRLEPRGGTVVETDLDLAMAAAGGRGVLVEAPDTGGMELAAKSDVMTVRTASAAAPGLVAAEAAVTRVRLGLEGAWRGLQAGGGALVPRLEIGVRGDGGDAETGFGADIGAGLGWSAPEYGIEAEVSARGLLTHEDGSAREHGFAGSLVWDPRPDSDRGLRVRLAQAVGGPAAGGMEALLSLGRPEEPVPSHGSWPRRLEARLGYGFGQFGDRYTGTPEVGFAFGDRGREVTLRYRLAEARRTGLAFGLDLEGSRRENAYDHGPAHGIGIGIGIGWRLESPRGAGESFEVRFEGSRRHGANDHQPPDRRMGFRLTARW